MKKSEILRSINNAIAHLAKDHHDDIELSILRAELVDVYLSLSNENHENE